MKKRNPAITFLLSIISIGLGQLYNGQIKKTIGILFAASVIVYAAHWGHLFETFRGFLFITVLCVGLAAYNLIDAVVNSLKLEEAELKPYQRWYVYAFYWLLVFIAGTTLRNLNSHNHLPYRLFRQPASSMSPTLLDGDDFVVKIMKDPEPNRGDLLVVVDPIKSRFY